MLSNAQRNSASELKAIPVQAWTGPEGFGRVRVPEFIDSRHIKENNRSTDVIFGGGRRNCSY